MRASLFAPSKDSNLSVAVEVVHVALFLVRDSESLRLRCRQPIFRSATLGRGVLQRRLRIPTLDFQTESLCHSLPRTLPRSVSVDGVCLGTFLRRFTRIALFGWMRTWFPQQRPINGNKHFITPFVVVLPSESRADKPATPLQKV